MECLTPITLNNGTVVPCGHCELCLSHRRSEWSVRVQIHADSYERMPLFVTLTYDNEHLTYGDDGEPTLVRSDFSLFIKRYKDRYKLYNSDWSFFGCGEYGDRFQRPHGHLIIFGDHELENLYDRNSDLAVKHISDVWQKGRVHICVAAWSGIHYVTKYVLKENPDDWDKSVKVPPFTFASQGIGLHWLKSPQAMRLKKQLERMTVWREHVNESLAHRDFDTKNITSWYRSISDALEDAKPFFPDFRVLLPSGKYAFLPREIRRRLLGSFEHFKDNPLWLYNHLNTLRDSLAYYRDHSDFDKVSELPFSLQTSLHRVDKIRQRLIINHYNKLHS